MNKDIFFFLSNVNWLPGIGDVRSGHDQLKVISLESIDQLKQALKRDQAFGSKPLLRTINDQNLSSFELQDYNRQPQKKATQCNPMGQASASQLVFATDRLIM